MCYLLYFLGPARAMIVHQYEINVCVMTAEAYRTNVVLILTEMLGDRPAADMEYARIREYYS
jgi:hypothetical protein